KAPGDIADVQALPCEPQLEELRRLGLNCGGSAASPVSTATSSRGLRGNASDDDRRGQELLDAEGDAAKARPCSAAAAAAAVAAANAAQQAAAVSPVTNAEPPAAVLQASAFGGSSNLRARLGAALFARVKELATVSEPGVRPISRNPQIEEPEVLDMPSDLPFTPLRFEEVCSRPHAELEAFLTKVYRCIAQGSPEQKISALKYLDLICCHMQVADLVVNSSLLRLVLRMLNARRGSGPAASSIAAATPALRARLLSLIGQLLRHACYLQPGEAEHGLFDVLLEGLTDADVSLRRRAAAAVGELLFYIATQPSQSSARPGSSVGGSSWQVPRSVLQALVQVLLSHSEDEVVQHYVAKTVENVATQCPDVAYGWFYSRELLQALASHVRHSSCEHFRQSCLAAGAHLWRGVPEDQALFAAAVPADGLLAAEADLVTAGLADLAPQGVPHALQLIAQLLLRTPGLSLFSAALPKLSLTLVEDFLRTASQPRYNPALRGRATVLLVMLCALDDPRDVRNLRISLEKQLSVQLDRLAREDDGYVVQCLAAVAAVLESVAIAVLQSLVDALRRLQVETADALEVGHATAIPAAGGDHMFGPLHLLPTLLNMACSAVLCGCLLGPKALPLLGAVFDLAARALPPADVSQGSSVGAERAERLQPLVLMVMEALTSQQGLMLEHAPQVVRCLLPALATFLPSSQGEVRLLALKCFCGVCVLFLNDDHIFDPMAEKPSETSLLLDALLCSRALPALPVLLTDLAPAPSYALRLLATLLSRGSSSAGLAVRQLGLAKHVLASLGSQQGLAPHTALLAHCLLQARQVSVCDLVEAGVVDAACTVLREAVEVVRDPPAQLDFAMVDAALNVAEEVLAQVSSLLRGSGPPAATADSRQTPPPELGGLMVRSLPLLCLLCARLARAKLASLLERSTSCCQHLADVARCWQDSVQAADLPARSVAALLESLALVVRWKSIDPSLARTLQRRILAVLSWAISPEAASEVRVEVAAGIERLLRERGLGDDPTVAAEAHNVIAVAVGRGVAAHAS
ncbi:unnamed protein product, partial [Polarella glacialis]